jgi:hypothetical protein
MTTSVENGEVPTTPVQWWGFNKEHGWVVLDRRVPCNAPGIKKDLLFLRCRDVAVFSLKRESWTSPSYQYAPIHIRQLAPDESSAAAAELDELKLRWPEFEREIQRVCREDDERAEAARVEEEKARKQAAAEKRKKAAADQKAAAAKP